MVKTSTRSRRRSRGWPFAGAQWWANMFLPQRVWSGEVQAPHQHRWRPWPPRCREFSRQGEQEEQPKRRNGLCLEAPLRAERAQHAQRGQI